MEEIEAALLGASVGETKEVSYDLADESAAAVTITIKHVNEKVLPEVDDELARSASEFDTLADLRADIEGRIRVAVEEEIDGAFRTAAVDALVTASNVGGRRPARRDAGAGAARRLRAVARAGGGSSPTPISRSPASRPTCSSPRCTRRRPVGRARARARGGRRQGRDRDLRRRRQGTDPRAGRSSGRRPRAGDRGHLGARPPGVAAGGPAPSRPRSTASSPT